MDAPDHVPPRAREQLLRAAIASCIGVAAIYVAMQPNAVFGTQTRSYAVLGWEFTLLDRMAGLGMVAAGIWALLRSAWPRVGMLAMVAGLLWLLPDVIAGAAAVRESRQVAVIAAPVLTLVLAHLVRELRRTSGARPARPVPLVALYTGTLVASIAYAVVYDHQFDPTCWNDCAGDPIVLLGSGAAGRLTQIAIVVAVGAAAAWLAAGAWRWQQARDPGRRGSRDLIVAAAIVFALATIAAAVPTLLRYLSVRPLGIRIDAENPTLGEYRLLWVLRAGAFVALAAGLAWRVFDAARTAWRIRRIAAAFEEAPPPGSLQAGLSAALDDPTLRVWYWLEHEQRYVDAQGRLVDPPDARTERRDPGDPGDPGDGSTITIRRGRQRIAAVSGATGSDVPAVQRHLGAAALTALDNERLRAAVLFQLAELRASRERIVARGDGERRRLERDLHDGAQQRLLAVTYDLRVARAAALAEDRGATVAILDAGAAEVAATVEELRRIAHGIHPVILTEEGLGAALTALAEETPIPLELAGFEGGRRCSAPVESAAYVAISEAALDAARRGATHLRVALAQTAERLTLEATDDASEPGGSLGRAADRVWAAGGQLLRLPSASGAGTSTRVELPCG